MQALRRGLHKDGPHAEALRGVPKGDEAVEGVKKMRTVAVFVPMDGEKCAAVRVGIGDDTVAGLLFKTRDEAERYAAQEPFPYKVKKCWLKVEL